MVRWLWFLMLVNDVTICAGPEEIHNTFCCQMYSVITTVTTASQTNGHVYKQLVSKKKNVSDYNMHDLAVYTFSAKNETPVQ